MQQGIEATLRAAVAAAENRTGLAGKPAGRFDLTGCREFPEALEQESAQARLIGGRFRPAHQPGPSLMPRCCLAAALIICGFQGGS